MEKAKLKPRYHLPIGGGLARLHAETFREVQEFARWRSGNEELTLVGDAELEALHDAYFLMRAGVIKCEHTDCLPGDEGEGIVVRVRVG